MTTPLVTVPTTAPRSCSPATVAANATSTWVTTASRPTMTMPARSTIVEGAVPTTTSATVDSTSWVTINRRRSSTSPSGTNNTRPMP